MEFARGFVLSRSVDVSGVSGTGVVAWGCRFPDGTCVLRWIGAHASTVVYASVADVEQVHGHGGSTLIAWDADGMAPIAGETLARVERLATLPE